MPIHTQVIGTALVAHSPDVLFFFTSRYHCLTHSTMAKAVDFGLPADALGHRWFDKFWMPALDEYKPPDCHHLANFAVDPARRGEGCVCACLWDIGI